jgi:uncharacterized NAD(P)/FAD-binding protein YdhS
VNSSPQKILIVGGGASGVLSAIALIRQGIDPKNIDIAEPRELLGEGLAYQTRDALHRLNVPSGRLSAIEELPEDFAEWSKAPTYSFMERRTYSTYLRSHLSTEIKHLREIVVDISEPSDGHLTATFSDGVSKEYDAVVLAMGLGKARIPEFLKGVAESPRIIWDVWDGTSLPESRTLLCFGTGLTFIDIALTHLARDPKNQVIAISGSGNLPERHVQNPTSPFNPTVEDVNSLEKLRAYLAAAGDSWREAVDGLRPITEAVWRSLSVEEREEFLRTDGSAWFRRRHRIAPEVGERIDAEIAAGRIEVIKGMVAEINLDDSEVTLTLEDGKAYSGDYLALCIGRDYQLSDPLTRRLLEKNKCSRGPLGMGLAVDVSTGLLLKPDGSSYRKVYTLGPLRSGEAFESTAIPELRKQASLIAKRLTESSSLA